MNFLHSTSQKFTEIPRFYIFWNDIIYLDLLRNLLCLRHKVQRVQRVPQCMFPRRNWVLPPPPLPQASVPLTPEAKGGGHTCLRVRGWGSPNSDDWRKSLALCRLCGLRNLLYSSEFCTGTAPVKILMLIVMYDVYRRRTRTGTRARWPTTTGTRPPQPSSQWRKSSRRPTGNLPRLFKHECSYQCCGSSLVSMRIGNQGFDDQKIYSWKIFIFFRIKNCNKFVPRPQCRTPLEGKILFAYFGISIFEVWVSILHFF